MLHNRRIFARGVLVKHCGGIPPVLVGFLGPSIVGADVALDDARRLGRTGRAGDARAAGAALPREACARPI